MERCSAKWRQRSPKSSALKMVSTMAHLHAPLTLILPSIEYRKVVMNKQKLAEKKSENDMVMTEFNMLAEDANVFKMVGPILAKQSVFECKDVVQQRLNFIAKEIARLETLENEFQGKITDKTNSVKKIQTDF